MVEIFINSNEIKKSIFIIVLFNAVFPELLEKSGIMINVKHEENTHRMCYDCFINTYDSLGLNKVAE